MRTTASRDEILTGASAVPMDVVQDTESTPRKMRKSSVRQIKCITSQRTVN
jgi:hypothetical protein